MATVCQNCGGDGFEELMLICDCCKIMAVHRYCMGIMPIPYTLSLTWICEDCAGSDWNSDSDSEEVGQMDKYTRMLKKIEKIKKKKKMQNSSNHNLPVLADDHELQDSTNVEPVEMSSSSPVKQAMEPEREQSDSRKSGVDGDEASVSGDENIPLTESRQLADENPQPSSDHKRKLENIESEQHAVSIDNSNEVSVDDEKNPSDFSQAKRTKLDTDGLGTGETLENGEERPEESEDGNPVIKKVQDPIIAEESETKMDDNGKPEDNEPASVEAETSQEVSVEESKEVNISGIEEKAENHSKETNDTIADKEVGYESKEVNDAFAHKEIEYESKEVNDGGSQKEIGDESKEVNVGGSQQEIGDEHKEVNDGGSQKEIGDECKEVNGSGSHEGIGDESKEANGGSSLREVDDTQSTTRRIEVPSSKVGTLIGKGGEMVRNLQINSGAKIQIRRDAEADPNSTVRPVELIGNIASIEKAEKLIHKVIAESEAGGVPALAARGIPEEMEIKVPNDKAGVIIGRGGQTIKNMETKSRARIQLIPQNAEGDGSKERTVRISGDKRQIDIATALIKDVMYQDGSPSHYSGGFNQPGYQPRGPGGPPRWGSFGPHGPHSMPYNYHHGGPYPSQGSHFRPPNSGGYPPQHMPPRSGYGSGWEQRPPYSGPYDYYGRQGPPNPGPVPSHVPPYSQAGPQQNYGQMYDQPHYDNHHMQQSYGGYGGGQHQMQQPSRPYGMQGSAEQGYGPPRPAAPLGDVPYQGPTPAAPSYGSTPAAPSYDVTPAAPSYGSTPAAPSYGSNMAPQQQYGFPSSAPAQQTYPSYSSAPPSDGYNGTQTPAIPPAYERHGAQPASGVQQTSAGYGQAPPTGVFW